ncbi:MAG: hypothetical protein H0U49_07095 [Parachlamydiaceae bacterium]|nr:hypothetical protein [Parachlamydiaceae bacterium]
MIVKLQDIASARSGDKGANSNIGVIAHTEHGYQLLKMILTTNCVQEFFSYMPLKSVVRYEIPNLRAFNFILYGALGEGGSRSLSLDAQGKALGQKLLQMPLPIGESQIIKMQLKNKEENP